jgi:protein-disulfide isomerase
MKTHFSSKLILPVSERYHISGASSAPVTLVEYGDYECPYCGLANPIVDEIRRELGDGLRFVFRNFPLSELHRYSEHAAEIAEAAGTHHKFWEMHDML